MNADLIPITADIGLTRKDIHEASQLRDAEPDAAAALQRRAGR